MSLTIGSLFSGIGGLELGLEWAGLGPVVWQVEQDEYCRAVLAKHWPNVKRHEDVRCVGATNLKSVDVICGGFPCQDISVAGKRVGLAGARSGLFYEFARIIRELRPRYAVLENVTALLANGLGSVLSELAESGYDAEWDCLPACSVGAPHQRDRIFILAYPAHSSPVLGIAQQWGESDGVAGGSEALAHAESDGRRQGNANGAGGRSRISTGSERGPRRRGEIMADTASARLEGAERGGVPGPRRDAKSAERDCSVGDTDRERELQPQGRVTDEWRWTSDASWWSVEPDVGRVAHGVPSRVDRLRALGNAVVPAVAEIVGQVILAREEALKASA